MNVQVRYNVRMRDSIRMSVTSDLDTDRKLKGCHHVISTETGRSSHQSSTLFVSVLYRAM